MLSLLLALVMLPLPGLAEKPDWAGNGKNKQRDDDRNYSSSQTRQEPSIAIDIRIGGYFGDSQRGQVRDYYREESRSGRCPPGLAKKNNGCLPPGQAKKWSLGQPLPYGVVYDNVDARILVRLGKPPAGTKFVRVAADILLIAIGTSMVIDAIEDLGR